MIGGIGESGGIQCEWKVSNKKDDAHGGFAWISVETLKSDKPTGICVCSNSDDINEALSSPYFVGYIEDRENKDFYICDNDHYKGCKKDYFIYYTCG